VRLQLWTWFIGMLVTTLRHLVGPWEAGAWRISITPIPLAPQAIWVSFRRSAACARLLPLLIGVLPASHRTIAAGRRSRSARGRSAAQPARVAQRLRRVDPPGRVLTVANYGYPIRSRFFSNTGVPACPVQVR
jgi:hypothetical protein